MKETRYYLWESCAVYLFTYAAFFFTSQGLQLNDYLLRARQFLIIAVVAFLVQRVLQRRLFTREHSIPLLIGGAWALVWPVARYLDRQSSVYIMGAYDIMAGAYLALLLILLQTFCQKRLPRLIYAALSLLLVFVPVAQFVFFVIYGHTIDDTSVMAICQTTMADWWEWIATYVGYPWLTGILLLLLAVAGAMYCCAGGDTIHLMGKSRWIAVVMVALLAAYWSGNLIQKYSVVRSWLRVQAFLAEQQTFDEKHPAVVDDLVLQNAGDTAADRAPGTILIVIGESSSTDHLKAYHEDYPYDDTPWMSSMLGQDGFYLFSHAYGCYNQTAIALSYVMTESSQYNGKRFVDSLTIVDIARKAGYCTYWFTNQGWSDKDIALVTMVAKGADVFGSPQAQENHVIRDGDLVPCLEQVDGTKNNFIVLHLIGSHSKYNWRYTEDAARWHGDEPRSEYANSLLYTDMVLQQMFEYAQQHLNLKAMVYFSDHGENIFKGHTPQITTFDQVRIPLFVYLSPEYENAFPEQTTQIRAHRERYFSNDMMYDTLAGLMGVVSNHTDVRQDLTSPSYAYDRDNVKTFLGKRMVSEDEDANE